MWSGPRTLRTWPEGQADGPNRYTKRALTVHIGPNASGGSTHLDLRQVLQSPILENQSERLFQELKSERSVCVVDAPRLVPWHLANDGHWLFV